MLAAVAGYGLAAGDALPTEPLEDEPFDELVRASERHRVLGMLGAAVRAEALATTAQQRDWLEERFRAQLAHCLRVERLALDAVDALDAAGIEHRVLKGVALAHTVYPSPDWRVFADIDLLVAWPSLGRAVEVLNGALGTVREVPELRPGFDARFGKEILLRTPERLELDVHRMFVEGAMGLTIDLGDLFASPERFTLGGRTLATLAAPMHVLHAAYAAVLGDWPPRLIGLRDLVQVLVEREPEPPEVVELARRSGACAVLARALVLAEDSLTPGHRGPLIDWAAAYRPRPLERLLLAAHVGPGRAYTRHAAALLVLPGVRDRLAYLRAIVWPQPEYLAGRGFSRRRFARRALRRHG